jgi:universal stress protein A
MALYSKVLLALDFFPEGHQVVKKAVAVAKDNGATLHLIHVLEPMGVFYNEGLLVNLEAEVHKSAEQRMTEYGKRLGVSEEHCFLRVGRAATEIHDVARQNNIDLIVMGGHGQAGLQLLLGSTANSVLHGTECDVLVVRIKSND